MDPLEKVLQHYRHPSNFGRLEPHDCAWQERNPVCGDDVRMEFRIDDQERIEAVRFSGEGCALTTAAASLLTETLAGQPRETVEELDFDTLKSMVGMPLGPSRFGCVALPLHVARKALTGDSDVLEQARAEGWQRG